MLQDIRSFFSPKGKTAKPGASKVEDKRGKPASKQDSGKARGRSKVSLRYIVSLIRKINDAYSFRKT